MISSANFPSLMAAAAGSVVTLGAQTHGAVVEGAEEAVVHHRVHDVLVADAVAGAGPREQVGSLRHRLHAPGDDDVGLTGIDHQVGQVDGVEPGQAHLVDGGGGHAHGDAGIGRGLSGGDLPRTGQDHLSHKHVVDLFRRDAGPLECPGDGEPTQLGGREPTQRAGQLADRGSGP